MLQRFRIIARLSLSGVLQLRSGACISKWRLHRFFGVPALPSASCLPTLCPGQVIIADVCEVSMACSYRAGPASARLAGQKLSELDEVESGETAVLSLMDKVKHKIYEMLQKYGFWAIVACASVTVFAFVVLYCVLHSHDFVCRRFQTLHSI